MKSYHVRVDRGKCFACGMAPRLCSEVFVRGQDNGKTKITPKYAKQTTLNQSVGIIPATYYECAKQAVEACPYNALSIREL